MLKVFLRSICRLLFQVQVRGHTPQSTPGRLLVIANHESFLDGLLLGLFLPFRV